MKRDDDRSKNFRFGLLKAAGGHIPDFLDGVTDEELLAWYSENAEALAAGAEFIARDGVPGADIETALREAETVERENEALLQNLAKPDGAMTGREMHSRLARSGPPLDITIQGLPKRYQARMSIDDALSASVEDAIDRDNAKKRQAFIEAFPSREVWDGLALAHEGKVLYPEFQFDADGALYPMMREVLKALPGKMTPWERAFWLVAPAIALDGRLPISAIHAGDRSVVAAAERERLDVMG